MTLGWIYRFWANPGRPWGGILPPAAVLAPGSALGSRPRVALSSAQVARVYPLRAKLEIVVRRPPQSGRRAV